MDTPPVLIFRTEPHKRVEAATVVMTEAAFLLLTLGAVVLRLPDVPRE